MSSNPGIDTSGVPGGAIWSTGVSASPLGAVGSGIVSNIPPSSPTCSIRFDNGNTFRFGGIWLPDPPGFPDPLWDPTANTTEYHWACADVTAVTPSPGDAFSQGKTLGDSLIAGGTYFSSREGHSGAADAGPGLYDTNGSSGQAGQRAFYYSSSGAFICTWGAELSGGRHWHASNDHNDGNEGTTYNQRCTPTS